jgi:hypothetical protein
LANNKTDTHLGTPKTLCAYMYVSQSREQPSATPARASRITQLQVQLAEIKIVTLRFVGHFMGSDVEESFRWLARDGQVVVCCLNHFLVEPLPEESMSTAWMA